MAKAVIRKKKQKIQHHNVIFNVIIHEPPTYSQTVIVIGGLLEHYTITYGPVLDEWSKQGYQAIGIGVPYERHLKNINQSAELIQTTIQGVLRDLALDKPLLVLHSGASIVFRAETFNAELYTKVILWSAMGLHHPERHPKSLLYAALQFQIHAFSFHFRNFWDWRVHTMTLLGVIIYLRNLTHIPELYRAFYTKNIRTNIQKNAQRVHIMHGVRDAVFPLDNTDTAWLNKKTITHTYFKDTHWQHAGIFSNEARRQTTDIINDLSSR